MKKTNIRSITILALCAVINIVGAFIAVSLKLPIYLDCIGTFLGAFLFGPIYGVMVGVITVLVNGLTFDPISFYYIPVQVILGFLAGFLYEKHMFKKYKSIISIIIISSLGSIVAAIITYFVFGGVTSAGSSYIVAFLKGVGVPLSTAVFITQWGTDIIDKSIEIALVLSIIPHLPMQIKGELNK